MTPPPRGRHPTVGSALGVALSVGSCLLLACSPPETDAPATSGTSATPPDGSAGSARGADENAGATGVLVRTGRLRRDEIRAAIEVTTDVESQQRVDVYPKVGPAYVERVMVDEGDAVSAGDPLVYLNDADFRIALRRRQSELKQAKQRVEQSKVMLSGAAARERMQQAGTERARADYDRAMAAMKGTVEVLSAKEIADLTKEFEMRQAELEAAAFSKDQANTDLELANLAVEAAEIEVDAAEQDLEFTVVRSLIDGVVQQRNVHTGVLVNSNTLLFTMVDPKALIANLRVPQEELKRVSIGMPVEFRFDALAGAVYTGTVEALNPAVDPTSGLSKVRARLPDDAIGMVKPGMFSRARIVVESRADALLMPKRAIVYERGLTWFFSVVDGRARRHEFQAGATTPDEVELLSVDGGEPDPDVEVIVVGQDRLRDGDAVTVAETTSER